jgi:hypothetical protein
MRRQLTKLILGGAFLALGIGAVTASTGPASMADLKESVQAIADALAKGDEAGAQKLAADVAKTASVEDAMHLFGLRKGATSKAYGVGATPKAITPDGIEAKINNFKAKAPAKAAIEKDAEAFIQMAYRTAAISEVVAKKAPEKDMGDKKAKDWITWSNNMKAASLDLASALKATDPAKIRAAASKINQSCTQCHGVFRD